MAYHADGTPVKTGAREIKNSGVNGQAMAMAMPVEAGRDTPCMRNPHKWDVDASAQDHREAKAACQGCHMLNKCLAATSLLSKEYKRHPNADLLSQPSGIIGGIEIRLHRSAGRPKKVEEDSGSE